MLYLIAKAVISAIVIVAASEIARARPAIGGLILSLPLVALLALVWLWRDTGDAVRVARQAEATFWYVLPTLPMFLLLPAMLRAGAPFWAALAAGVALTLVLYLGMTLILARAGMRLD